MKNRCITLSVKNIIPKYSFILLLLLSTFIFSCTSVRYGLDAQKTSRFAEFDELGIAKKEFIRQYGQPTNKGLHKKGTGKKIEKLYYTEKVKSFLVTTEFIFEDNILKQMERVETINDPQNLDE